jgi:hypothetical protein
MEGKVKLKVNMFLPAELHAAMGEQAAYEERNLSKLYERAAREYLERSRRERHAQVAARSA